MNIFVTGSNGYIGSEFIKKIKKKNLKIFAVTRKRKNKKIKNVKWLVGSIDKKWKELSKSEILIHLAATGGYERFPKFKECYEFNYLKSKKLIHNSYEAGCRKWIIVSTKKEKIFKNPVFNNKIIKKFQSKPDWSYAFSKALFSNYCFEFAKEKKVLCRILRFFHVYGGNEKQTRLWPSLVKSAKKNKDFFMSSGNQKTDFNYIKDVIDGLIKTLDFKIKNKNFPQIWEFGSGKNLTVKKFAEIIWKKLNPTSKLMFSNKVVSDKTDYKVDKKKLWKISYTHPSNTV